jgi:hypothetical protein
MIPLLWLQTLSLNIVFASKNMVEMNGYVLMVIGVTPRMFKLTIQEISGNRSCS